MKKLRAMSSGMKFPGQIDVETMSNEELINTLAQTAIWENCDMYSKLLDFEELKAYVLTRMLPEKWQNPPNGGLFLF